MGRAGLSRLRCCFLTMEDRGGSVIDDELALQPLEQLGIPTDVLAWRQAEQAWGDYDLVVIRSTWDYFEDVDRFLDVLTRIDQETVLANPLSLVRWNLAKTYLIELEANGVPIVPTLWPGTLSVGQIRQCFDQDVSDELVVKPIVGANGVDTFRLGWDADDSQLRDVAALFVNRAAMIQPFMPCILDEGEYSLFYFNGEYSHAIRKKPAKGEFRSQEERGAEIRPVVPGEGLRSTADHALSTLRPVPLYARVDLVRDGVGEFRLIELELIEPSMYLRMDAGAPMRLARAIAQWAGLR